MDEQEDGNGGEEVADGEEVERHGEDAREDLEEEREVDEERVGHLQVGVGRNDSGVVPLSTEFVRLHGIVPAVSALICTSSGTSANGLSQSVCPSAKFKLL